MVPEGSLPQSLLHSSHSAVVSDCMSPNSASHSLMGLYPELLTHMKPLKKISSMLFCFCGCSLISLLP